MIKADSYTPALGVGLLRQVEPHFWAMEVRKDMRSPCCYVLW